MRKVLSVLLMLCMFALPITAEDWTGTVEQVLKSIVYVESAEGSCTGFVIDTERKYVMSAEHCDASESKVWVDRVLGNVISKDTKKDLLVFEVKNLDPLRPALKLASKDPEIGQEVMSAGYGMGLERPFFRKAMISDTAVQIPESGIGGPYMAIDAAFVGGQSGGPVVNHKGEVVMIVQRASSTTGIGVSASVIRERMGRFFGK